MAVVLGCVIPQALEGQVACAPGLVKGVLEQTALFHYRIQPDDEFALMSHRILDAGAIFAHGSQTGSDILGQAAVNINTSSTDSRPAGDRVELVRLRRPRRG